MKLKNECFIIAEAGVNHNGDLQLAYKLVYEASKSGANAVKFQTFNADTLVNKSSTRAPYQQLSGDSLQHEMLSGLQLTYNEQASIKQYCDTLGIEFISTAYDEQAVTFLKSLGVKRIKNSFSRYYQSAFTGICLRIRATNYSIYWNGDTARSRADL